MPPDKQHRELVEKLREMLAGITPVADEIRRRDKGDGEERYDLIGDPCGFPVATFGDANDAAFDLAARQLVPAAATAIEALVAENEAMRRALEPFAKITPSSLYPADGSEAEEYMVLLRSGWGNPVAFTGVDLARARAALKGD
jgi:hypothetical protein